MTLHAQELWYLVFVGVGLFEVIKSRGRSWTPIFCLLSGAAVFLSNVEGAIMLIFGAFALLLQNLQTQQAETEAHSRSQKVILGVICGLIFLSSSLKGEPAGQACLLIFVFLITTDWPFEGVLQSKQKEELVETNEKVLIYVPTAILIDNVFVPNESWVSYVFWGLGLISFFGKDKDRAMFLLFCGLSWMRPELRILAPAITILCLGSRLSSMALQLAVLYLVATVVFDGDTQINMVVLGLAGAFVGWMLADQDLPSLSIEDLKKRSRDIAYVLVSFIAIGVALFWASDIETLLSIQPEYLSFIGAAILVEVVKRLVPQFKKVGFNKALNQTLQDLFSFVPLFKTQERQVTDDAIKGNENVIYSFGKPAYLENTLISMGLFATILWSIVIWFYYST